MTELNQLVVVTGAASGIGKATAISFAKKGYCVIAGVKTMAEANKISGQNIEPFKLDITQSEDIKTLVDRIESDSNSRPLRALINNAGIEFNAPLELLSLTEWHKQFDVNLFGQVAITQALLPQLRKSRGTIVNITSVGGRVALPNYSAYAATKFAFEAASDALRREVKSQGIKVIIVEPGGIKTDMAAYSGELSLNFADQMNQSDKQLYQNMVQSAVNSQSAFLKYAMSAKKAGDRIAKIATKSRPRARYSLGIDAHLTIPLNHLMPTKLMDLMLNRS
ncbi:SDR family oxidoreductase [Lentilactobacillus kosonis]|uniref:Oxidoreductase, short-chain dehydrogenase/reductase family n=1 Tax=Lentilactobacillus kosonis TaxID=2810561 RepID=A0A401FJA5_9LACO|nr:SDR family oxidoreductase [Lentilactobacillus kosonis]GAY72407.1 oxidoreductase, short-chain dehydrogenase/reductase family [Lentilactobacillus kosonis]